MNSHLMPMKGYHGRFEYTGYSFMAPQGDGWYMMRDNPAWQMFAKDLKSKTHTFIVGIIPVRMAPTWKDNNGFLVAFKTAKESDLDPGQTKKFSDYALENKFGATCVRYHFVMEGPVRAFPGAPVMTLDAYGYGCLHPQDKTAYAEIQYSERYKPGESDPSLKALGDQFVNGFMFRDLPK